MKLRHEEIPSGRLLVTVSGGADSTALLLMLVDARADIVVAHCNFHLRGEDSNLDAAFVRDLCRRMGVELYEKNFDIAAEMERGGESLEMCCRRVRYDWFRELKAETDASRIVTAHHADDNIETFFLNLLRGTGIHGLTGMEPDNGEIYRPLLKYSKREILEYLAEKGETYRTDKSNLTSDYRRNFLRNEVMPLLRTRWPAADKSISTTIANLRHTAGSLADEELKYRNADFVALEKLTGANIHFVHKFIDAHGFNSAVAGEVIAAATERHTGAKWSNRRGEVLILERDGVRLYDSCEDETEAQEFNLLNPPAEVKMEITEDVAGAIKRLKSSTVKLNDTCLLPIGVLERPEEMVFRRPVDGDRIKPLGMRGSSLVSDIIKDAKLDSLQKRKVYILEDKSTREIIWVTGLKRSRKMIVSETDEKAVELTIRTL